MDTIILGLYCLGTYLIASLWETFVHWKLLHCSNKTRLRWKTKGGVYNLLRRGRFSHNVVHHRATYKENYFVQFRSADGKRQLDGKLNSASGGRIIINRYGLTVSSGWEILGFTGVPAALAAIIGMTLNPLLAVIGIGFSFVPFLLSKYIHPLLHVQNASQKIPNVLLVRPIIVQYISYIQRYHFIHHKRGLCNFNLMPGGDILLGVARDDSSDAFGGASGSYR